LDESDPFIVGCPSCITSTNYSRNALLFNIAMVFKGPLHLRIMYSNALSKLAFMLRHLEMTQNFLSSHQKDIVLPKLLKQVIDGLSSSDHECNVIIDDNNAIQLKLFAKFPDPPEVPDHQVPVPITDLDRIVTSEWDLTLQQIIPFIDGTNYVKKIALIADVNIEYVRKALEHLLYYKLITMVDIFQYCNMYTTTSGITRLAQNRQMQLSCIDCITIPGNPPPRFEMVFGLYCALKPGVTLNEFCEDNNLKALNIDIRSFITFGVVNKFLRRLHKFPLTLSPQNPINEAETLLPNITTMVDGKHSYDEICCAVNLSYNNVDAHFDKAIYR